MGQSYVPAMIREHGLGAVLDIAASGWEGVVADAVERVRQVTDRPVAELAREAGVPALEPPGDAGRAAIDRVLGMAVASTVWAQGHPQWRVVLCAVWIRLVCSVAADADIVINVRKVSSADWVRRLMRQYGLSALAEWAARIAAVPGLGCALYASVVTDRARCLDLTVDPLSTDPRTDISAMAPRVTTPLVWAGIDHADFRCRVTDGLGGDRDHHDMTARLAVGLPANARGAHTSRLQEILLDLEGRRLGGLPAVALWLAERAMAGQPAVAAHCWVSTNRAVTTTAPATRRQSSLHFVETATVAVADNGSPRGSIAFATGIATACPGTLAYSRLRTGPGHDGDTPDELVTFTHMQPGTVRVEVSGSVTELPGTADLLDAVRRAAHTRESLLKRPDEHEMVERVHRRPQLAEDVSRAVAAGIAARLPETLWVRVDTALEESIHSHRVVAAVGGRAHEFWSA
ncbi:MAG TPA: GTP cyclohydrolase, FolE2/MptA family [Micromonosporaceae bacterium]|nr:GTP cyclohydrolase, FolE2/MptA family [Micromonosporaceae bacterium]